jgi:hypothetical protein
MILCTHIKTNIGVNKMSKKKTVRYSSHWYEVASNKHDFRNNERYKKSCELINIDHTFGSLIRLKEYNKSLYKLWEFLSKDENKHIIKTLSKQDKDFYFLDLGDLWFHVRQLTTVGLEDEKNVDDWTVFSFGHVGRKSKQDNVKGVN